MYGEHAPDLQTIATEVLSLACSTSGSEHN